MLKLSQSQRGMTAISMAMLLLLIGFVMMIFAKLLPTYLENFKVNAALKGLKTDARAVNAEDSDIRELIHKKLQIDDVDLIKKEDIIITHDGSRRIVSIIYETRVPMFGNVDALVRFSDNSVELR